jgi:hypothetical protein
MRTPVFRDGEILPSCGWGPWRSEWYSFCSKLHGLSAERRAVCPACNAGVWRNVWVHRVDALVWVHARPVALWWHNRPRSKARRTLEAHFPGLRKKKS